MIPFERFKWMAVSYRGIAMDDPRLDAIVFGLLEAHIPTHIVRGEFGPILVTWQRLMKCLG